MAMKKGTHKSIHDVSFYGKCSTDLEGMVCTKCHEMIRHGQTIFMLNFGRENRIKPMAEYLRFSGLVWHANTCLKVTDLPGCEDRVGIEEEFARAMSPCIGKMTH